MKAPLAYKAITLGVLGSIISISQVSTIKYRFSDDFEIRHLISAKFAAWLKLMENWWKNIVAELMAKLVEKLVAPEEN